MPGPVERWLETFMCKQYADTFEAYGFKTLQQVCQLQVPQLQAMGVAQEHCEKILENVHVLRQTLLGPMNHYSEDVGGGYGSNPHRTSNMGGFPPPDNPGMVGMPPNMSGYPSHGYGEQAPPAHMMMPQQQPFPSAGSGMYHPSSQQQQFMGQPFMHPYPGSPYDSRGSGGGGGGGGVTHPSFGNMTGSNQLYRPGGTQTSPRHHHMRHNSNAQTPQEVANNILQMAASSYSGHQTVQVPLSKHRTAPYHVPNSSHYNMQSQSQQSLQHPPGSPKNTMMGGLGQFVYPSSSPHHQQQARTSPISPMLMHSPVSHHSNQSLPNSSPGSLHSPAQGSVKSPVATPSPIMRSPCAMQSISSPMGSTRSLRSPPLNQQLHVSVPSSHSSQMCGSGAMQSPSQQHSTHYSPIHNPLNSPLSHQGSPYPSTPQAAINSPQQNQLYQSQSSSTSSYINSLYSQEANHMTGGASSSNPLQSLQKLCMLPEKQVVDPKSIVNDACLPSPQSTENSKNGEGGANQQKAGSSCGSSDNSVSGCGSASTFAGSVSNSTQCMDGKHCEKGNVGMSDGVEASKDKGLCSSDKTECVKTDNCVTNTQKNCKLTSSVNNLENHKDKHLPNGEVTIVGENASPVLELAKSNEKKLLLEKENVKDQGNETCDLVQNSKKSSGFFFSNVDKYVKTPQSLSMRQEKTSKDDLETPFVNGNTVHHKEEGTRVVVNGPTKGGKPVIELNGQHEVSQTGKEQFMNYNTELIKNQENADFVKVKEGFEELTSPHALNVGNIRYVSGNRRKANAKNTKTRRIGSHLQNSRKMSLYDIDDDLELETLKVRKDCRNTYSRHARGVLIPAGMSGQDCLGSLQRFSGSSDDEDWISSPPLGYGRIHRQERKFLSSSPRVSELVDSNNISSLDEPSLKALSANKNEHMSPPKGESREQSVSSNDGEVTTPVNPNQKARREKSSPPVSSKPSASPPGRTRQKQSATAVLCDRQQGKKDVQESKYCPGDQKKYDTPHKNGDTLVDVDLKLSAEEGMDKSKDNDEDNDADNDSSDDSDDDKALITYKSKEKFLESLPQRNTKESVNTDVPNSQTRNSRMQTRRKRHRSSWSRYEENFFKGDFIFDDEEDSENVQNRKRTKKTLPVSDKPIAEKGQEQDEVKVAVQPHYSPISDAIESDQENVEIDMEADSEETKPVVPEQSNVDITKDLDNIDPPIATADVKEEPGESNCEKTFLTPTGMQKKRGRPVGSKNKMKKHKVRGKSKGKVRDNLVSGDDSFSAMKLKKTLDLMKTKKKKVLNVGSLSGPYIKIDGSRRHPNSCVLVNQPQEVKMSDSKITKRKKAPEPSHSVQISKLPTETSVVVPGNRVEEGVVWVCALCGKHSSYKFLGDLFGPYYVEHLPGVKTVEEVPSDSANSKKKMALPSISTSHDKADKMPKGRKAVIERRLSGGKSSVPDSSLTTEVWVHEDCVVWADGVYLIGQNIYGLQEAKRVAKATNCSFCKESGAMVGCLHKGCSQKYHFVCAVEKGCSLNEENFSLLCLKHKDKKLKYPTPSGPAS